MWEHLHPPASFTGAARGPKPALCVTMAICAPSGTQQRTLRGSAHRKIQYSWFVWGFFLYGQGGLRLNQHHKLKHKTPWAVGFPWRPATTALRNHLPRKLNVRKNPLSSPFCILKRGIRGYQQHCSLSNALCSPLLMLLAFPLLPLRLINQEGEEKKKAFFFPDSALSGIFHINHVLGPLLD